MARLPRTDALLVAAVRAAVPSDVTVGSRIPDRMPVPFIMVRRAGGSSIHPEFLDQAVVDAQVWAGTDSAAEDLAQAVRDALYRASRYPQFALKGVGSIAWFSETSAPTLLPSDSEDHDVYRYQATYVINARPDQG
ncbi:hypothetical protein GCM10027294_25670 [Marinactinospora endophytica]